MRATCVQGGRGGQIRPKNCVHTISMAPKGESKLSSKPSWRGFVFFVQKSQKSPGKFCHWIFNPGNKWSQKSWNFLPSKEKNPGIFSKKNSWIPWKIGIPGIFWSQNFPSWNILSGNFLSWDFISRKILAFSCVFDFPKISQYEPWLVGWWMRVSG